MRRFGRANLHRCICFQKVKKVIKLALWLSNLLTLDMLEDIIKIYYLKGLMMQAEALKKLVIDIQKLKTEKQTVELKSAEIPGVDITERPVFYKGVGRIKGSYIRVGESDEPMSEYEVYSYEAFRKRTRDNIRTVDEAKLQLLDEKRLNDYLTMVKQERRILSENVSNEEILELMAVTSGNVPTLAGIMTFSKYPQTYFPQLCITAVSLPGTEMGTVGESGERFIDNKRITGAIPRYVGRSS